MPVMPANAVPAGPRPRHEPDLPPRTRTRGDLCPGLHRPWVADDGLLVRLRLVGGRVRARALRDLLAVAEDHGDGRLHVTARANLQLRALPDDGAGRVRPDVRAAVEATGLVPHPRHELVRNVLVSPGTGLPTAAGGRADLRPVAERVDAGLCADAALAALPGRFLFVLDDGRGDLLDRDADLGLVALDADRAQLVIGGGWGAVVPLADAPARLLDLARAFLTARGGGAGSAWHVRELGLPLAPPATPDPALPPPGPPLPFGRLGTGIAHHPSPRTGWGRPALDEILDGLPDAAEVIVTPGRGLLVGPVEEVAR